MEPRDIGIIGINGNFGRVLKDFFEARGCSVIGSDIGTKPSSEEVVEQADVVIFSVGLGDVVSVAELLAPRSHRGQLWIDISARKTEVIKTMLSSESEVLGIHPLFSPESSGPWVGETIIACLARISNWEEWVKDFLRATGSRIEFLTPEQHDAVMLLEQNLFHVGNLGLASVLMRSGLKPGELIKYSTKFSKKNLALIARMLSKKSSVYTDIQIGDGALSVLDELIGSLVEMRGMVAAKNHIALEKKFDELKMHFGEDFLGEAKKMFPES